MVQESPRIFRKRNRRLIKGEMDLLGPNLVIKERRVKEWGSVTPDPDESQVDTRPSHLSSRRYVTASVPRPRWRSVRCRTGSHRTNGRSPSSVFSNSPFQRGTHQWSTGTRNANFDCVLVTKFSPLRSSFSLLT